MAGLNKVILIGNIGKDPEVRQFDNGGKKISFSLATNESYKDKDGNWQEQTEWHNVIGWNLLAEKPVAKGDLVYVEGKIKSRDYKDKDGNTRYITEIVSERINIITKRGDGEREAQGNYQKNQGAPAGSERIDTLPEADTENDLPF